MPTSCKKTHDFIALRVFSNIDAASLPQNVYYRVIAVREGGPRPGDASRLFGYATTPPRTYEGPVRRSGGIATPSAPVPPNPVAFDHGISPFDFARTGFDQWSRVRCFGDSDLVAQQVSGKWDSKEIGRAHV